MAYFKCSGALFNGTITINTTAGATVTATTASTTRSFQAVANAGGVATIRVKKRGTYNIASTGTTRIGHATVSNSTPVTAYYNWNKYNNAVGWTGYVAKSGATFRLPDADSWDQYYMGSSGYTATGSGNINVNNPFKVGQDSWHYVTMMVEYSPNVYAGGDGIYDLVDIRNDGLNGPVVIRTDAGCYRPTAYAKRRVTGVSVIAPTSYNYRGGYVGVVTSTSLGTYPDNGRSGDGYWYLAT